MTELYFVTDLEFEEYSWIGDFVDIDDKQHSYVEITSETFDQYSLNSYLEAIDRELETWNYHNVMGFAGQIADGMKLVGVDEKTIKKMFYDWIIDRGLCIGLDR